MHVKKNKVSHVASLYGTQHPVTNKVYRFKGLYGILIALEEAESIAGSESPLSCLYS
jgi:hypothetical protein